MLQKQTRPEQVEGRFCVMLATDRRAPVAITRADLETAVRLRLPRQSLDWTSARSRLVNLERITAPTVPLPVYLGELNVIEVAKAAVDEFIEQCKSKGVGP